VILRGIRAGMACCRGLSHLLCCSCCPKSLQNLQNIQVHHKHLEQVNAIQLHISIMFQHVMRVCMLQMQAWML
jgi:hypothetical protein